VVVLVPEIEAQKRGSAEEALFPAPDKRQARNLSGARNLDAPGGRCYIAVSARAFREHLSDQVVEEAPSLRS
jgi:hypothetical protein